MSYVWLDIQYQSNVKYEQKINCKQKSVKFSKNARFKSKISLKPPFLEAISLLGKMLIVLQGIAYKFVH